MSNSRYSVKITGASGMGIDSSGKILAKVLKESGYNVFAYREYPSLIKGGHSSYQIDISDQPISSSAKESDLVICLERASVHAYLNSVKEGGYLLHNVIRTVFSDDEKKLIQRKGIHVEFIDSNPLMLELGGLIFTNIFYLGMLCQLIGLDEEILKDIVREEFADKPEWVELDIKAIDLGAKYDLPAIPTRQLNFKKNPKQDDSLLITGNEAIALGAIAAGVRAFFGYPMTPASSIQSFIAKTYHDTRILVKQAEDEITAAQMTLGAMFAGTRAMTATSGGGFDLMTESISLSGITETPFVCVLAQRPGPATGVPTWTAAGDLNLALYAAHGEFPRCVLAASDIESAFTLTQKALNIAEVYQIPVFLLTEKQIAESLFNLPDLPASLPIKRGLLNQNQLKDIEASDRFKFTDSGISPRWLPGQSEAGYLGNSDEHLEDGTLTEDAQPVVDMMQKRMRKLDTLKKEMAAPKLYGSHTAETIIIGWGSPKNTVLDSLNVVKRDDIAYLHFEEIWPLRADVLEKYQDRNLVIIENNYQGQLRNLIKQVTGIHIEKTILKYDGRPFFIEEILEYIQNEL